MMLHPHVSKKYRRRAAFTLTEVLITLAVVGVISALTIPTLVSNVSETEYNTGVESAFSILSQAIGNLQANNTTIHVGTAAGVAGSTLFRTDICSALVCIKQDTVANIFPTYNLYESAGTSSLINLTAAILSNGSYLHFNSYANCTSTSGTLGNICGRIFVDINGSKAPNMFGKDLDLFWIVKNNGVYSVLPWGTPGDAFTNSCVVGDGTGCTYTRITTPDSMP